MSDFIVRIDIALPKEVETRIAAAVQAAAMSELGRTDLGRLTPAGTVSFIPRKEWYGKWLRSLKDIRDLGEFGATKLVAMQQKIR